MNTMWPSLRSIIAWGQLAGKDHAGSEVDGDRPVEVLDLERDQAPTGRHPRVGDQDVYLSRFFREALGLAWPGQVGHDHASVAELLRKLGQRFLVAGGEHEPSAFAMQSPSDVRTQAGRGAGEEDSLAAKVH